MENDEFLSKVIYFLIGMMASFIICLAISFWFIDLAEEEIKTEIYQEAIDYGYGKMVDGQFFWIDKKTEESEKKKNKFLLF